jgi:hypothetical protein
MKRSNSKFVAVAFLILSVASSAMAQLTSVRIELPAFAYDVLYLADFIDVGTQKLASNIPDFSGSIIAEPPGSSGQIRLVAKASIRLQGDAQPNLVAEATTRPFTVNGSKTFSSRDLASGSVGDIQIETSREIEGQRKRLEDYAARFPTAPVGQYVLEIEAQNPTGSAVLGKVRKVISIRNASPDEVVITLLDPQPGAVISSIAPTFSWSSPNPKVKTSGSPDTAGSNDWDPLSCCRAQWPQHVYVPGERAPTPRAKQNVCLVC